MSRVTEPWPRAVFVGKSRAKLPPTPDDRRKYAIDEQYLHTIVVCTASRAAVVRPSGSTIVALPAIGIPVLGSAVFYTAGPLLSLALAAGRRNAVISCQSPYEAFGTLVFRTAVTAPPPAADPGGAARRLANREPSVRQPEATNDEFRDRSDRGVGDPPRGPGSTGEPGARRPCT